MDTLFTSCNGQSGHNSATFTALLPLLYGNGFTYCDILDYSYKGGQVRSSIRSLAGAEEHNVWVPNAYGEADPSQDPQASINALLDMLELYGRTHPDVEYYLVGHSMGGKVAFDAATSARGLNLPIRALITVDSPINHVLADNKDGLSKVVGLLANFPPLSYFVNSEAARYVATLRLHENDGPTVKTKTDANLAAARTFRDKPLNGIERRRILTIGNPQDCVWNVAACHLQWPYDCQPRCPSPGDVPLVPITIVPVPAAPDGSTDWHDNATTQIFAAQDIDNIFMQSIFRDLGNGGCPTLDLARLAGCVELSHGTALQQHAGAMAAFIGSAISGTTTGSGGPTAGGVAITGGSASSGNTSGISIVSAYPQGQSFEGDATFHAEVVLQATNGATIDCGEQFIRNTEGGSYGALPLTGCTALGGGRYRFFFHDLMKSPSHPGTFHSLWRLWDYPTDVGPVIDLFWTVGPGTTADRCLSDGGGVSLYTGDNYAGRCAVFPPGTYNDLTSSGLDQAVASIAIPNGQFRAYITEYQDAAKAFQVYDSSVPILDSTWKNHVRALRVEKTYNTSCNITSLGVILYRDPAYFPGSGCLVTTTDIPDLTPTTHDKALSSLRIVGPLKNTVQIQLFRRPNYQDPCGSFWQDTDDLRACADQAMSVKLVPFTPPPAIPVPAGTIYTGNFANQATLDPPGVGAAVDGQLSTEAVVGHDNGVGLSFPTAAEVKRIVVIDRRTNLRQNTTDSNGINSLILAFDNGTAIRHIDMISQGPRCVDLTLATPLKLSWLRVIPEDSAGTTGFAEIEVWSPYGPQYSDNNCVNKVTATPIAAVYSPPTNLAPRPSPSPVPAGQDLVVSNDANRSTDRQAHGPGNPYRMPLDAQFNTVTIEAGAVVKVLPWDGHTGGLLRVKVQGIFVNEGTIDLSGLGYRGGPAVVSRPAGNTGECAAGLGQPGATPNGRAGLGGPGPDAGGSGAGHGTPGKASTNRSGLGPVPGGPAVSNPAQAKEALACGGGSSGAQASRSGGAGGNGAGAIHITATRFVNRGVIKANGANGGSDGVPGNWRGGGAGAGGSITITADVVELGPGIEARGGKGGAGIQDNDPNRPVIGGDGGDGLIFVETCGTPTGQSTPTARVELIPCLGSTPSPSSSAAPVATATVTVTPTVPPTIMPSPTVTKTIVPSPTATTPGVNYTIAATTLTTTTVAVTAGTIINITYLSGLATLYPPYGGFNAAGKPDLFWPCSKLTNQPGGMLLGRIDSGPWFPVGLQKTITAPATGVLQLGLNECDGYYYDDSGALVVRIATSTPAPVSGTRFTVSATIPATDTIAVTQGTTVNVTALFGIATLYPPYGGYDAAGKPDLLWPCSKLTNQPGGLLLGRIGSGPWFAIGTAKSFVASATGTLQLGFNECDGYYYDDSGGVTVAVSTGAVSPTATPSPTATATAVSR